MTENPLLSSPGGFISKKLERWEDLIETGGLFEKGTYLI